MTQKIGIGVDATFDTSGVDRGVQEIGQKIDRINRSPINPVAPKALKDLDALNQKFQQLLRVDGELRRRIRATGQQGALFENVNWDATHPNRSARSNKINSVREYMNLPPLHAEIPLAPHPGRSSGGGSVGGGGYGGGGGGGGGGPTIGGMAGGIAQAGLRAGGSAGGVAASALGTGMSAGVGAGLGGLLGGLLALGVSKIVGGVMEKMGQAEDNNVAYDRLKRSLGDVGVAFDSLKYIMTTGANDFKVTFSEFNSLGAQFARAGNMPSGQYTSLPSEVGVGIGLSRSFGLDPSQGVGAMGQMRGIGVTKDINESRKFALLIGETIGKSGAFAKADEVMDAMGSYAVSQTRNSMSAANVAGYGGMFSSLVGSGIPGMDPAGAAGLIGRVNSNLSMGGAKGDASQFMTAMVGHRMGLDPLQTQVLRGGGAFATNDKMFGEDSAYFRYMGESGPKGTSTFLESTKKEVEAQYGGNSRDDKLLRAQAYANHAGVGINEAMTLLSLGDNKMGEMEKYGGDLKKLNAGGIGNLSKVVYGTNEDRMGVAQIMSGRKDLSSDEMKGVKSVLNGEESVENQKKILGALVGSRDHEMTLGRDIADSKNLLDNLKVSIADKLVPYTQDIRAGILHLAGAGMKTGDNVLRDIANLETKDRNGRISSFADGQRGAINAEYDSRANAISPGSAPGGVSSQEWHRAAGVKIHNGTMTPEERKEFEERVKKYNADQTKGLTDPDIIARKRANDAERRGLLDDVDKREKTDLKNESERLGTRLKEIDAGENGGSGGPRISSGQKISGVAKPEKVREAMAYFMSEEGGGWSKENASGMVANLVGESQMNSKSFNPAGGGRGAQGQAQWRGPRISAFEKLHGKGLSEASDKEQWSFVTHELTKGSMKKVGDALRRENSMYGSGVLMSRDYEIHGNGPEDLARGRLAEKIGGTPMPEGVAAGRDGQGAMKLTIDPLVMVHKNEKGEQVKADQVIPTKLAPNGEAMRQ